MPKCSIIDPLVTPFVDGTLASGDRRVVEQHLDACPPCRRRLAAEQAVHDLLQARKTALQADAAPPLLRDRCRQLCHTGDRPDTTATAGTTRGRAWWAHRLEPLAFAAALVLLVAAAFVYRLTERSPKILAAELTADHVKCFALNAVLRTHQSADVVQSSLAAGFDWHVRLPQHPEEAGLELVGSRPCLYGEGKVAHIMYRHNGDPVSLFMLPRTTRSDQLVDVLGHEAVIWSAGDRTFVLIAREARADVERIATFVHGALQSE